MKKHISATDKLLLQVLARHDAIWIPCRVFEEGSLSVNISLRRHAFASEAIPFRFGGNELARKQASLVLDTAAAAGLVVKLHTNERTTSVRLTEVGEALSRAMADMPSVAESLAVANIVADVGGSAWVPEDDLIPAVYGEGEGDRVERLAYLMDLLVPALSRGWIESGSTCNRNGRYRVGKVKPVLPDVGALELPEATKEHRRVYVAEFDRYRLEMKTSEPLPVSYSFAKG